VEYFDQHTLSIFGRLLLAAVLGIIIGIERELAHKSAGMRTHSFVALGSALFSIISMSFSSPTVDPTRIAAQIVTGIGFLGAGIIIFHDSRVQGLTTAAGIWVAAAIGMAIGFGFLKIALFTAALTVFIFVVVWPIEQRFVKKFAKNERKDLD